VTLYVDAAAVVIVCDIFGTARSLPVATSYELTLFSLQLLPLLSLLLHLFLLFLTPKKWVVPFPPSSPQPLSLLVPSNLTMRCTLTTLAGPTRTHGIPTLTLFSRMRSTRHLSPPFPWSLSPQSRAAMDPCHPSALAGAPHLPICPPFLGRSRI
jgi:hypothetical protein